MKRKSKSLSRRKQASGTSVVRRESRLGGIFYSGDRGDAVICRDEREGGTVYSDTALNESEVSRAEMTNECGSGSVRDGDEGGAGNRQPRGL